MHVRCSVLRTAFFSSRGLEADRDAASRHHIHLLDKRHWELSTPSKSLPVLGVLARSGVFVEGLEGAASQSLHSMTPFMTSNEQTMLNRVSHFFSSQQTHRSPSAEMKDASLRIDANSTAASRPSATAKRREREKAVPLTAAQAEELVLSLYSAACDHKASSPPDPRQLEDSRFLHCLSLPCCLMLLELLISRPLNARGLRRVSLPSLLERTHALLVSVTASDPARVEYRTVWWLLMALEGDPRWFRTAIPVAYKGKIFTCCVRLIHNKLPSLSTEQLLSAYLLLTAPRDGGRANVYERPFIVIQEAEKLIAATPAHDFATGVSTDTLLRFMSTAFLEAQGVLWPKLCLGWYTTAGRISDMTLSQSRQALHILSRLHMKLGAGGSLLAAGTRGQWQLLHDSVFAQIFVNSHALGMAECVSVLEDTEVIHVSALGISAPSDFLRRMKACTFDITRTTIKRLEAPTQRPLSAEEVASAYEAVLRFEALLYRYALVPCSDRDARIIAGCVATLRQHACRPEKRNQPH